MTHASVLPAPFAPFAPFGCRTLPSRVLLCSFVLLVCVALIACSFASFAAAMEEDIPTVIAMVTNITMFVAPGVSAAIQTAGAAAIASLVVLCGMPAPGASRCDPSSLVGQYQAATDSGAKTSLLQKIQAALAAANSHIAQMLSIAQGLPATVGAAIIAVVSIALQTTALLLTLIPIGMKVAARGASAMTAGDKASLKSVPRASDLKRQFNAAVQAKWPNAVIK
jgi:hypothetical protein